MRALALLLVLLLSCTAPQLPATFVGPTVRVALVRGNDWTDWQPWQASEIRGYLPVLSTVGIRFVESTPALCDVELRSWDSGDCAVSGRYTEGTRFVLVDSACSSTREQRLFVVGHELMHFATSTHYGWLGHVCHELGEGERCTEAAFGDSILNPHTSPGASPTPTALDRMLVSRGFQ